MKKATNIAEILKESLLPALDDTKGRAAIPFLREEKCPSTKKRYEENFDVSFQRTEIESFAT